MNESVTPRREILKLLGGVHMLTDAAFGQRSGQSAPQAQGAVTPSPTTGPGGKPLLTLYSISLQWAGYDEAADTAATAGWPAIGWTVRGAVTASN